MTSHLLLFTWGCRVCTCAFYFLWCSAQHKGDLDCLKAWILVLSQSSLSPLQMALTCRWAGLKSMNGCTQDTQGLIVLQTVTAKTENFVWAICRLKYVSYMLPGSLKKLFSSKFSPYIRCTVVKELDTRLKDGAHSLNWKLFALHISQKKSFPASRVAFALCSPLHMLISLDP